MSKTIDIADLVKKAIVKSEPAPAAFSIHKATDCAALRTPAFQIIHADELDCLPPVAWLVPGVLPAHSLAVLYGPPGCGKSFMALDLALRHAQAAPVLYVAAEGAAGYAARKLAWCKLNALPAGQCYFLDHAVNLLDAGQVEALAAAAAPIRPALLIFDTLARCMIGDENSSRDMGQFIAACDQLKLALAATILLIHHTGKNGLAERGSSALRAAADQMIELAAGDGVLTCSCTKSKDAREFEPRNYRLVTTETGRSAADGQPETSCAVMPAERVAAEGQVTPTGRQILETLALETFANSGARTSALRDATNLRPATLFRVLSNLLRAGYIRQTKRGDPYYITEQGQGALTALKRLARER